MLIRNIEKWNWLLFDGKINRNRKEREYMTLIAGIDAENEKSIALHQNYGFVHAGTIQKAGYKFNRWLDLAFYQLELNGPENPIED